MGTLILRDAKIYVDKYDVSGDLNQGSLTTGAEMVDATTFGATVRIKKPGLFTVEYALNGFSNFGAGLSDEGFFTGVGLVNVPHTVVPEGAVMGNTAYFFKGAQAQYSPGGTVGEMIKFSVNGGVSGGRAVRGLILEPGTTMRTATANTAEVLVGAASAPQSLYAVLHILELQGATHTLDVVIQSDTTGFPSPLTRITLVQQSVLGSVYATPVTGVTDAQTYYRVAYTIGGTGTPGFRFVVAVGIL
jgi:hypothetical protein